MNIAHLEILKILVALRVWHKFGANSKIAIACDNDAVVYFLNTGRTRDLTLAAIAQTFSLWLPGATSNCKYNILQIKLMLLLTSFQDGP